MFPRGRSPSTFSLSAPNTFVLLSSAVTLCSHFLFTDNIYHLIPGLVPVPALVQLKYNFISSSGNCQYSLYVTRFSPFDFLQVLTKKRMIVSLFPTLLAKTFLTAVLLSSHAGAYHKHYGLFMMAARFVSTEGKVKYIHTAV